MSVADDRRDTAAPNDRTTSLQVLHEFRQQELSEDDEPRSRLDRGLVIPPKPLAVGSRSPPVAPRAAMAACQYRLSGSISPEVCPTAAGRCTPDGGVACLSVHVLPVRGIISRTGGVSMVVNRTEKETSHSSGHGRMQSAGIHLQAADSSRVAMLDEGSTCGERIGRQPPSIQCSSDPIVPESTRASVSCSTP